MRRAVTGWAHGRVAAVGGIVLTIVLLGGFVLAGIPHTDGQIYACYKKSGQLRVIDPATEQCSGSERPLSWNQAGPPPPTATPGTGAGFTDIIGGSTVSLDVIHDNHVGLFGWHGLGVRGWSHLPVGGTLGNFRAGLHHLPAGFNEADRNRAGSFSFTVMCKRPGGTASSCNGMGPGPVETPVTCTIRQSDYASQPNLVNVVPECSSASTFTFAAGDWITVRVRPFGAGDAQGGHLTGGNKMQWQATYTH